MGIQLSCYAEESSDHLQLLVNLKELHVFQLTCKEFERLLLHLREVTSFWRSGEYPDWGIEAFVVRGIAVEMVVILRVSDFSSCSRSPVRALPRRNPEEYQYVPLDAKRKGPIHGAG